MKFTSLFSLAFLLMVHSSQAAISLDSQEQTPSVPSDVEGPMKEALDAFNEGRHVKAIDIATRLADKGNPDALFLLGYAHETGRGLETSREKAIEFYKKSSDAGQKDATYRLALILLSSKEKAEREQGRKNLEEAALKDPANAGRILGEAYLKGMIDEKPNFDQAVVWWNKASEAGDVVSIMGLARLFEASKEFPDKVDYKKSLELYQKAVVLGEKSAMVAAGSRMLNGDATVRDEAAGRAMLEKAIEAKQYDAYLALGDFEENIKKDFKAALTQYELGGANKQVECALRASDFYLAGKEGTEKNDVKATDWLRKAAETGNPIGGYRYAAKLLQVPEPDNRKPEEKIDAARRAYDFLLNAAIGGIPQAQNEMALFYLSGAMGVADPSAAAGWFLRASQAGNLVATVNLATLYERGHGVAQNFAQAGQLYEVAARQGNGQAAAAIARFMAAGAGTTKNIPSAWAWANVAIQNGDNEAKTILGEISTIATSKELEEGKKVLDKLREEFAKAAAEAEEAAKSSGTTPAAGTPPTPEIPKSSSATSPPIGPTPEDKKTPAGDQP
jgi:TPR repeat protein